MFLYRGSDTSWFHLHSNILSLQCIWTVVIKMLSKACYHPLDLSLRRQLVLSRRIWSFQRSSVVSPFWAEITFWTLRANSFMPRKVFISNSWQACLIRKWPKMPFSALPERKHEHISSCQDHRVLVHQQLLVPQQYKGQSTIRCYYRTSLF